MIVHVISYNLLTPLRALVNDLATFDGVDSITIIDNASTYQPLLEWYEKCGCTVIRREENGGGKVAFQHVDNSDWYVVTDCDLDVSDVPRDALTKLRKALEDNPEYKKAGLSLELKDLPETHLTDAIKKWEAKFWQTRLNSQFWVADVDTTFAVYRPGTLWGGYGPALRSDRPYTCRHAPWYWNLDNLTDEQQYYLGQEIIGTWWTRKARRRT
jgi:hypothetical protein